MLNLVMSVLVLSISFVFELTPGFLVHWDICEVFLEYSFFLISRSCYITQNVLELCCVSTSWVLGLECPHSRLLLSLVYVFSEFSDIFSTLFSPQCKILVHDILFKLFQCNFYLSEHGLVKLSGYSNTYYTILTSM